MYQTELPWPFLKGSVAVAAELRNSQSWKNKTKQKKAWCQQWGYGTLGGLKILEVWLSCKGRCLELKEIQGFVLTSLPTLLLDFQCFKEKDEWGLGWDVLSLWRTKGQTHVCIYVGRTLGRGWSQSLWFHWMPAPNCHTTSFGGGGTSRFGWQVGGRRTESLRPRLRNKTLFQKRKKKRKEERKTHDNISLFNH
jgi:hypothetical protein